MVRFALALASVVALLGCGGAGRTPSAKHADLDAFVGTWTGSYGVAGADPEGTIVLRVLPRGDSTTGKMKIEGAARDVRYGEVPVEGDIEDWASGGVPQGPKAEIGLRIVDPSGGWEGYAFYSGTASLDAQGRLTVIHDAPILWEGQDIATHEDFTLSPARR